VKSRRAQLLEFAVLGLLHEGPTHGYDLRRRLNTALGPFRALSYGTLYPALRDLLDHGLIAETTDPAGPSGRRPRVVYELTHPRRHRRRRELRVLARAGRAVLPDADENSDRARSDARQVR
jgi:DNA-binding PadR family transcriptional regulator